ncbi:Proteasome activator complex subunit 4 [Seminavis robusta]|uniref:Proteasome activator complex subunit 4 n=1 Tax=Seminavis robusta TaxID=568900 RepID=A0A9N8HUK3_9STRA|nr:Proteasome activator complex subunit 4 [Seminavis robusta]|eukprot:Sro1395_g269070.1 Proteasome activator complex subunit 4 (2248) ;mRNA; f:13525-20367
MKQDKEASVNNWGTPHAFHLNLPPNHLDEDGVPYITKFAHKKARMIVELAMSINICEEMFAEADNEAMDIDEEGEEETDDSKQTLGSLITTCNRLQSQLSILESLKHSGIEQEELCEIILHFLRLLSATVTYEPSETDPSQRKATLHYENVGYLYRAGDDDSALAYQNPSSDVQLEDELTQEFAMPAPAREVLLFFLINLLGNKGPLRSVSNASVYLDNTATQTPRFMLIVHWKPLLRMFLRTAPYLDEHKVGKVPSNSNSRQSTTLQRTVQLIRDARHFFDQGFRPPSSTDLPHLELDRTAKEIWSMVKTDVKFHSHTHACYRSSIILYLFQPSRCTADYYLSVLPEWYECWTNIDRCPEYDFLWLAMFCRARKHVSTSAYDWGPIRRRILTHSQYWLQLPIGGASMDKLFPRAGNPRSRSCPSRLKEFVGSGSSYEEGIDFVAKVTKLLVASLGAGEVKPASSADTVAMSEGTRDMLRFLSFVTPYFNPSNLGSWTFTLGAFLHYFSYELCCRVGNAAAMQALKASNPALYDKLCEVQPSLSDSTIPEKEMVALMHALLPLCQQAMYSKNGHVGRAGEAAMLYLIQIDPMHTAPAFIDFATRALDISAVNLAHQAPAALSALTRLIQPALRSNPSILLARIPDILRLCLAGIDRNDQNKTIRTLILYRSITSWMPVGGQPEKWVSVDVNKIAQEETNELTSSNGTTHLGRDLFRYLSAAHTSPAYMEALEQLPTTSLLRQGIPSDNDTSPETHKLLMEEAAAAMDDWILEFLDRIFTFLRASGEREKVGKTSSGVASRHSSVDVQQARNFSRVLQECLAQVFAALNGSVFNLALRSVTRFFHEDTLPWASKDASFVCQAVAGAREIQDNDGNAVLSCPGLDALVPILTDDLEHHSIKTVSYRLRCLAGAVKGSSHVLVKHKEAISKSIDFALASTDKHLFKVGCKLLRHSLASLCEAYPVAGENMPRTATDNSSADAPSVLGRSAQLAGDGVKWHVPNEEAIEFAASLVNRHILQRLEALSKSGSNEGGNGTVDIPELRRCLRVIRYSLRGGSCVLLDKEEAVDGDMDATLTPHELASQNILKLASEETRQSLSELRGRLALFMVTVASIIANETYSANAPEEGTPANDTATSDRKYQSLISTDAKICKETCDIALLLLTRRGANFRSQEARNIWKAQKQSTTDFSLCAMADHIVESLQRAALYCKGSEIFYKDGEDAGKTIPRRLLVTRVKLFHDSLKRNASFEIPRRLRRLNLKRASSGVIIFDATLKASVLGSKISEILGRDAGRPLVGYEGLMDGLFSLCCHSNTQVRAAAISVVDYAITRFGWLVKQRVPRLLSAISMQDVEMHGKFGIPSTFKLKAHVDGQGKRKRLAEAMKGVISLLALPRSVKEMMASDNVRFIYIKTACGTDELISLMPTEETQKMVHYLHSIFSKFRSKFYSLPRTSRRDQETHDSSIHFLLDLLSENVGTVKESALVSSEQDQKAPDGTDQGGISVAQAHWRKLLLVCWFIMSQVNVDDLKKVDSALSNRLWTTCFRVLENEMGQPLQRVALGLFGRLVALTRREPDLPLLRERMVTEEFCKVLGKALVYDHKEDSSFGGGHDAQWSAGIEDMIRDASRNVAPRTLFPFQRTSQSSTTFKITHAQLVYTVLAGLGKEDGTTAAKYLLAFATEIAASPPSEDQRNQQCTSAEIFSGVCRAMLLLHNDDPIDIWTSIFLPYLDDVIPKIPVSFIGAYFDALRFALQFSAPNAFFPLTAWLFKKVESTLWQPKSAPPENEAEANGEEKNGAGGRTEGFTAQSKWLYLSCALLIEIDETEVDGSMSRVPWYTHSLAGDSGMDTDGKTEQHAVKDLQKSWDLVNQKLLPRLTDAVGHPYESCRDHIAGCLFRICHCHRKKMRVTASRSFDGDLDDLEAAPPEDPGSVIVRKLSSLETTDTLSFNDRYNALITTRRFFSYCIHLGEAKHEYSDYIVPLLPLAFEALKSNIEEGNDNADAAQRTLEAEVVKGYRYTIAELSVTSVISYGDFSDITRVLDIVKVAAKHEKWQVRHACAHFLRSFQGSHKFLFSSNHADVTLSTVTALLADDRREVSSAAMAALTGILAASPVDNVARMVKKYVLVAKRSSMKKKKKGAPPVKPSADAVVDKEALEKEQKRASNQLTSVFFLCASVLAQPYETPPYVPEALAAISKHSFERNAPLGVRDTVKKCCAEYKRTHMSDNWELHRSKFSQEQLEALQDVVSSPHYYA